MCLLISNVSGILNELISVRLDCSCPGALGPWVEARPHLSLCPSPSAAGGLRSLPSLFGTPGVIYPKRNSYMAGGTLPSNQEPWARAPGLSCSSCGAWGKPLPPTFSSCKCWMRSMFCSGHSVFCENQMKWCRSWHFTNIKALCWPVLIIHCVESQNGRHWNSDLKGSPDTKVKVRLQEERPWSYWMEASSHLHSRGRNQAKLLRAKLYRGYKEI